MKTIQVKTNIMCGACVTKVTPILNEVVGKEKWRIDTANPEKILLVKTENLSEADVIRAVKRAGYTAETLN